MKSPPTSVSRTRSVFPQAPTRYSRRSHPVLRDIQQRIADVTTNAEEAIVGVRVVKAFAQEDAEGARFAERTERVFERELDSARIQARYSPLLDLLPQLAFAVIILVGGLLVCRAYGVSDAWSCAALVPGRTTA